MRDPEIRLAEAKRILEKIVDHVNCNGNPPVGEDLCRRCGPCRAWAFLEREVAEAAVDLRSSPPGLASRPAELRKGAAAASGGVGSTSGASADEKAPAASTGGQGRVRLDDQDFETGEA